MSLIYQTLLSFCFMILNISPLPSRQRPDHKMPIGVPATLSTFQTLRKWREEAKGLCQLGSSLLWKSFLKPHQELLLTLRWPKVSLVGPCQRWEVETGICFAWARCHPHTQTGLLLREKGERAFWQKITASATKMLQINSRLLFYN